MVAKLDELLEEHKQSNRSLNDIVREASTVDELRREVETPSERAQRRAKERLEGTIQAAKRADPEEVARYGLGVGHATLPLARAAPWSTHPLIGASLALGTAAGLHASGVEDSPLAEIDPIELTHHVHAMAAQGSDLEEIGGEAIDGEVVGALLGASHFLGAQLLPEDYAEWVIEADPSAIMAGADAGARYATAHGATSRQGAAAGAGLGLLTNYADDGTIEELREAIDDDLYQGYLREMTKSRIEAPD